MATKDQIKSLETREQRYRQQKRNDMYIGKDVIMFLALSKLTTTALKTYLVFLTKRSMKPIEGKPNRSGKDKYRIANQGEIQFTYKEARKTYGINPQAFATAIDQLVEAGLIDIAQSGSGLHRDVTLYAISDRWQEYGTDEFKVMKRPKRTGGYGFSKGHKRFFNVGKS